MRTVELGRTGEQVSHLALGCMLMGTATDEASSFTMLDRYVDAGGNFLDTANCYAWWPGRQYTGGESESLLGRWFARSGRRDEVFLATKGSAWVLDQDQVWAGRDEPDWDLARANFEGAGADTLRRAVDDSLRRLRTDHIDLYYVHVDDRSTPLEETLATLDEIVRSGKVRYIGWSNVRTWRLERIRQLCAGKARQGWPAPVAVQQQHTYLRRRAGLVNHLHRGRRADGLPARTRRPDPGRVLPDPEGVYDDPAKRRGHYAMAPYEGPDAEARLAVLTEAGRRAGGDPNQLVLAWLLHQESPRTCR